jgi:hypothetical protein
MPGLFNPQTVVKPQGIKATNVTPLQLLKLGLSVDADALGAGTRDALAQQLKADNERELLGAAQRSCYDRNAC